MEIIEKNIESNYDKGFTNWHCHKSYSINNAIIKISDSVGGCGLQQIYGWYTQENNENIDKLLKYVIKNLHHGTSCVVCQVGEDFYNSKLVKALEDTGFYISIEYNNLQHGGNYKQRLYMYVPEKAKLDE